MDLAIERELGGEKIVLRHLHDVDHQNVHLSDRHRIRRRLHDDRHRIRRHLHDDRHLSDRHPNDRHPNDRHPNDRRLRDGARVGLR